ncbi:MAG: hypothetical protein PHP37_01130 [Patescibacteria group bacterium]|nr:hypothetical protein [Patescibacteria group bacterium]
MEEAKYYSQKRPFESEGLEKIKKLERIIREKLERVMAPCVAGRFGDEHFSFDAASYYTLVKNDNGKEMLVKLGWGEMSSKTFLAPKEELTYPETNGIIREIPIPIYCLSQSDSYFANSPDLKEMEQDPSSYLKEKAIFVYDKDGAGFVGNESIDKDITYKKQLKLDSLPILNIDEAISRMENFNYDL